MLLRLVLWGLLIYFAVKLIQTAFASWGKKHPQQPPASGDGTKRRGAKAVDIPQSCIRDAEFEDIKEERSAD